MLKKILLLSLFLLPGRPLWADEAEVFIDPDNPTRILKVEIPFVPQVILMTDELPQSSTLHAAVPFSGQKFSYLALSPDGSRLAFSVDGDNHDWTGVLQLSERKALQLTLRFDSQALQPYWSTTGRHLVIEESGAQGRRQLRVFNFAEGGECLLEGRGAKNKFFNFSDPWFSAKGEELYFKVEVNDQYRRSLGLKAMQAPARIGEATWDCKKLALHPVSRFLAEHPAEAPPERLTRSFFPGEAENRPIQ